MDKRKIIIPAVILLLAGGSIWWFVRPAEFIYAGTIEATEITLSPRVASVIEQVKVQGGDKVEAGQTLVILAGEDLKLAAKLAESDFQRAQRLLNNGSITRAAYDKLRFQRDQARLRQSWCEIKAPAAGVVLNKYREPGETVRPGVSLLTLGDLSEVWAFIYVEQPKLAALALGQEVKGMLPEMLGRFFPGRITMIRKAAEFTPKNVQTRNERTRLVYGVKILFSNPEEVLKPGMTIEVKLPETQP
jgi:HlyD family secretion protein